MDRREKKLEKKGYKPADDIEKKAAEALQLEEKSAKGAREAWEQLQSRFKQDATSIKPWWWLLAAKRLKALEDKVKNETGALEPKAKPWCVVGGQVSLIQPIVISWSRAHPVKDKRPATSNAAGSGWYARGTWV